MSPFHYQDVWAGSCDSIYESAWNCALTLNMIYYSLSADITFVSCMCHGHRQPLNIVQKESHVGEYRLQESN